MSVMPNASHIPLSQYILSEQSLMNHADPSDNLNSEMLEIDDALNAQKDDDDLIEEIEASEPPATRVVRACQLDTSVIGQRFDQIAAQVWSDFSREKLKHWLAEGVLKVDHQHVKGKARSNGTEYMTLDVALPAQTASQPEAIELEIIFEDEHMMVINKPVGLVVHPGAGHSHGTLVNALLYHYPQSRELPRAGLVHRIDKDTSGLLVVAKTLTAQLALSRQLAKKTMYRVYDLICYGNIIAGGKVDEPIKRHPVERTKMTVAAGGKPAVTHYRVLERFADFTLLQAQLETGRTHQIRVHFAHLGHALLGDSTYARLRLPRGADEHLVQTLQQFKRQALHARYLGLLHPYSGVEMQFEAPLPDDFLHVLQQLRLYNQIV